MSAFTTLKTKEFDKVRLVGLKIEPRIVNDEIEAVRFTDVAGRVVVFSKQGYNGLSVMVPKPKTKKEWRVAGVVAGIEVTQSFDSKAEAETVHDKLKDDHSAEQLEIDEVEVEIETGTETVTKESADDLPF